MLNTGPWFRLPLVIQWLKQDYQVDFPVSKQPPLHMSIAYGPISVGKSTEAGKRGRKRKGENDIYQSSQNSTETQKIDVENEEEIGVKLCNFCGVIEVS